MPNAEKSRAFFFTWNNYTEEDLTFWRQYLEEKCDQWAWQCEVGEQGTPHIQAALYFKSQRTFSAIKKELPKVHIESVKSWKAASAYCQKVKSRDPSDVGDIRIIEKEDKKPPKIILIDPMDGLVKKPWQIKIDQIIAEPAKISDRKIHWFYDTNGSTGKTTYAKHLSIKHAPNFIYVSGKSTDIKAGIASMVSRGINPDICVFDFTRTVESFVSYEAIESLKNGIFYSGKYESTMVNFNPPHIIVFSNFHPVTSSLSLDRWSIEDITENKSA